MGVALAKLKVPIGDVRDQATQAATQGRQLSAGQKNTIQNEVDARLERLLADHGASLELVIKQKYLQIGSKFVIGEGLVATVLADKPDDKKKKTLAAEFDPADGPAAQLTDALAGQSVAEMQKERELEKKRLEVAMVPSKLQAIVQDVIDKADERIRRAEGRRYAASEKVPESKQTLITLVLNYYPDASAAEVETIIKKHLTSAFANAARAVLFIHPL